MDTKYLLCVLAAALMIGGCASKTPPNQWQIESAESFDSYTQSYLKGEEVMAQSELSGAIEEAKRSADIEQLERIYLGACALEHSVGEGRYCTEYRRLSAIRTYRALEAYASLLEGALGTADIEHLPPQYQTFAQYRLRGDVSGAFNELISMKRVTSQLIAASLIKDRLNDTQRDYILGLASKYGYKKSVLFWLRETVRKGDGERKAGALARIKVIGS